MDDLDAFAPDPVRVALAGQAVEVRAVTLVRLKSYRALARLARDAMAQEDMLGALAEHAPEVNRLLADCLGCDAHLPEQAGLDEIWLALCAVLRVNSDFLAGAVSGAILRGTTMLIAPAPDGGPSLPGSSGADTGLTTSSG